MIKIPIKANISYLEGFLTAFVVIFLTAYFQVISFSLIIPLLLFFIGLHLYLFKKANIQLFLHLGLLLSILAFTTNYVIYYTNISVYYTPVASIAMLTMLLFNDLQLSFLICFLCSTVFSLMTGGQLEAMLIFFIGNLTASYSVRDARTRGKVMGAGIYVGLIQVLCLILFHPDMNFMFSKSFAMDYLRPLFANGVISALVVVATLKIFEMLCGVLTNFSLIELSDKDQPLLKKMRQEAPGTYIHTMYVGDLAETAADAIGANALLTRVGAYYHDIGKINKPEYYTENQIVGGNKHDHIEPSMSRLVILNHVKEGIEMAKKQKLNPRIIEFIPQHHGTSLMHYFYQKALEEAEDNDSIKEENYRYPGPKPQSRETAIVLLADSVEGATRAIDEPNPQKIDDVVRKIINNKFIDGQLDECNLTLKEINAIAETFTKVLSAMHHGRVKYPEKKNGSEHRNQKSTEEHRDKPSPDQKDRQKHPEK